MRTAKQDVQAMIGALPDDTDIEEIQYRLYVLDKIRAGVESIEKDGGIPHDEVVKRMAKWLR